MRKQFSYKMPIWKLIGTFMFFFAGALALSYRAWRNEDGLDMYFIFKLNVAQAMAFYMFLAMVSFMFCLVSLGFIWSSMRYDRFVVIENGTLKIPKGLSNKKFDLIDLNLANSVEIIRVKSENILEIFADAKRYQVSARWLRDETVFNELHRELNFAIEKAKDKA